MKTRLITVLALLSLLVVSVVPFQTASAGSCRWYTVRRGDNLSAIARMYGVSVASITSANGIANANRIYSGQSLCIPDGGSNPPPQSKCVRIHVVKKGQTLKKIANIYGVTVATIRQANGLKKSAVIRAGQKLRITVKCPRPGPPAPPLPPPASKPWKGYYWDNQDLSGSPKFVRNESAVNFSWGSGAPAGLPTDHFSARWTRTMHFSAGNYLFHVNVDDGVRLFVDGEMLINEWHESAPTSYGAEKKLTAGNHVVQIEYFEHNGAAQIRTQIELLDPVPGPSPSPQALWHAEFWNNEGLSGTPAKTATYRDLYFEWGNKSPMTGIAADYFSSRFVGDFSFTGGSYRFYLTVDDGVRLYVDDALVLDEWHLGSRLTHYKDLDIAEGKHRVKVEHYEHNGDAVLKVFWSKR